MFLGFKIGVDGISTDEGEVEVSKQWSILKTIYDMGYLPSTEGL